LGSSPCWLAKSYQVVRDSSAGAGGSESMESAFEAMRHYAQNRNLHLANVARSVVDATWHQGPQPSSPPAPLLAPGATPERADVDHGPALPRRGYSR